MTTLRNSPYSLPFDTLIQVKAYALNHYGNSTASPLNTDGARIRTEPYKMSTPTFSDRNSTSISLTWPAQYGT